MSDRRGIHIFLGAPPPPSDPPSQDGTRPSATWRHLKLTWRDGQLTPAADLSGHQLFDEAERMDKEDVHENQDCLTNPEADPVSGPEAGQNRPDTSERPDAEEEGQCSTSLHLYLDSCFPTAHPAPGPGPGQIPAPGSGPATGPQSEDEPPPVVGPPSTHTHYLTTWTLSQALILRSRHDVPTASSPEKTPPKGALTPPSVSSSTPELFSQATPSLGSSAELFSHSCSSPRVEEGGVVLQVTTEGVLCSQESKTTQESPIKSPSSKRPRLFEECRTEAPEGPTISTRLHSATTLLPQCNRPGVRYTVLVVVVHPCHLKEVKVKSGPSAGTFVPLASIVVTDQSGVDRKVVLWRRAAFWAVTVNPGDVVFITGLQVNEDRWRGETLLQSTFSSKLLNLGHVTSSSSRPVTQVDSRSLTSLCNFVRERRPLLASMPLLPPQDLKRLPYAPLRSLRVNTLVHALLRVTHTHLSSEWRGEAGSYNRSARKLNAVLTVEQADGQQGALLLWGSAVDWLPQFNRDRNAVWDFHLLLVRDSVTSDLPELHSTPWSWVRPVEPSDRRAQDFLRSRRHPSELGNAVELDLDTLLSQKYSGEAELQLQVLEFHFKAVTSSQNAPQQVMDSSTPLEAIMAVLNGDITYTGCGRCTAELDTDANGIYCPCYPCLPHTAVRRYYRPAVLTVRGQGLSQVSLHVPPEPLQTILSAPPDKLHRASAPGSSLKNIQLAADRIGSLLSRPRRTFVVRAQSHFLLDENSATIHQEFTLLHLQLPEGAL
ncbi:shieldin complex subunit 2 [Salarias fasciatus]|uniref:Uncharacterized protein n=1 Tax=Salarias fasciatus TaxID=181472 RepID=A0A672FQK5_SALFA|nr:shieldin complex subunit 2 [Salarias fasciatus]XP_029963383.1 shieldin complex subunit 2 [Salarias fasciatus]XP_029963384.1 shieldin complex subunit 2 [Salarias fasciatus]XP_029963385.1 shieldin complex subunit 2 [Salarias fasciatus]